MSYYICPMHPEVREIKPGRCPKCQMELLLDTGQPITVNHDMTQGSPVEYLKLAGVFVFIAVAALVLSHMTDDSVRRFMEGFMGFFFVTFGLFKTIKWKDFAYLFNSYDIVAKKSMPYAFSYPAIEIILGLAFLFQLYLPIILWITLILMIISSIGVFQNILAKNQIPCACLGNVIKLPLSKVSLFEDVLMGIMAAYMLFL